MPWIPVGNIKGPPGDVLTIVTKGNFFFGLQKPSGLIPVKFPGYWKAKYDGTISGWDITVDVGTVSIQIWKIPNGTAAPTNSNAIGTIDILSGTSRESTDVSMFSTLDVLEGDIFGASLLSAAGGVKDVGGSIWLRKLGDGISGGGEGPSFDLVTNETPTGTINGVNMLYSTSESFRDNDLDVYLNGIRQKLGLDYLVTSASSFTMTVAPQTGDILTVDYIT